MNQLDLLLPFGLPPRELARDLMREMKMPALATLLAKARRATSQQCDDFSHTLPHEQWLATLSGLPVSDLEASSPPLATMAMRGAGLAPTSGFWFLLQPVNLHIARDHLVLADPRQLDLSDADSRTLFAVIQPLLEEAGHTLLYGDAQTWFMRADDWHALRTSTPDAACGHNIDIWMPKGSHERDWRRVQNEIQMHWHGHRVNDERAMRGLKPVNSVWLWGGATSDNATTEAQMPRSFHPATVMPAATVAAFPSIAIASATDLLAQGNRHGLLTLNALAEPAMSGDWGRWLEQFQALEAAWFVPLLEGLRHDRLARLNMTLSHNTALTSFAVGKASLRKFWIPPSLARLSP